MSSWSRKCLILLADPLDTTKITGKINVTCDTFICRSEEYCFLPLGLYAFATIEMGLSLFAQYHIRQLLHEYSDRLHLVAAPGRALSASENADLNAVVEGLYLEDAEIERVFQQLNTFATIHSGFSPPPPGALLRQSSSSKQELEAKMLRLLGLELMPLAVTA